MEPEARRSRTWLTILLCSLWAVLPAFLFYVLILQPKTPSVSRLALSALLLPALAYLGYRAAPRLHLLSRTQWFALLVAAAATTAASAPGLSMHKEKAYLFHGPHRIEIRPLRLTDDQSIELRWFSTALGDVSLDALPRTGEWRGSASGLQISAPASTPLVWHGLTGDRLMLSLRGSPGAALRISWDGQSRDIDLAETRGRAQLELPFPLAWWAYLGMGLLLFGATFPLALIVALGTQIAEPRARLPAWTGFAFLTGLLLATILLSWNTPADSVQLPAVLTLSLLLIAPTYLISGVPAAKGLWSSATTYANSHLTVMVVIASCILTAGIFGRAVLVNWAVFDDHQILQYVGPGRGFSIGQMLSSLPETEIGRFGTSVRFRPSYWFLRLLECVVWGARPYLWHAFRLLILAMAVMVFWQLMARPLGWAGAGLLCAYTFTFAYWQQIITWLGPGETYALGGLALYAWGSTTTLRRLSRGERAGAPASLAVLLGTAISAGSKENFVLLAVPSVYLAYRSLRARDAASFAAAGSIAFAAYVSTGALMAVLRQGADVYSHAVSPAARIRHLVISLGAAQTVIPLMTLVLLMAVVGSSHLLAPGKTETRKAAWRAQGWLLALLVMYVSQIVFYNGEWPTGIRYDFPGLLYIPAGIVILTVFGRQAVAQVKEEAGNRTVQSALGIALLLLILWRGYGPTTAFVDRMVRSTNEFVLGIESTASTLQAHRDHALVIESGSVDDYESIFSHERFLRSYGVQNSVFLRLHGYGLETAVYTQEEKLTEVLVNASAQGARGIKPLRDLGAFGERCYSLTVSGDFQTACKPLP
jgi:hypothetical protein